VQLPKFGQLNTKIAKTRIVRCLVSRNEQTDKGRRARIKAITTKMGWSRWTMVKYHVSIFPLMFLLEPAAFAYAGAVRTERNVP
jgi:hypothetical protein